LQSSIPVEVSWGNPVGKSATFKLSGFDIRGSVHESSATGEPVSDVNLVLYSKTPIEIEGCTVSADLKSDGTTPQTSGV